MYKNVLAVLAVLIASAANANEPKFSSQVIDGDISIGYGLTVGEVDGDQRPDILLADKKEIVWYKNPGKKGLAWTRHVMARNLTQRDNVCIAARDLNGDGLVEVAVGANWNPGETTDTTVSGAIFYLHRPNNPADMWRSTVVAAHDPTTHRMHWMISDGQYQLVVLPLHGRGNRGGAGKPVRVMSYTPNADFTDWKQKPIDESMHMTHNFDLRSADKESLLVAGKEGIKHVTADNNSTWIDDKLSKGAGEVRHIDLADGDEVIAIEPMHGTDVAYYRKQSGKWSRTLLDGSLAQGHALAAGDFMGTGKLQVIAGWRNRNSDGRFGIRLYSQNKDQSWTTHVIDDNTMACEDLKLSDLNGDGKPEIIGAGRATKNVVVYWNEN